MPDVKVLSGLIWVQTVCKSYQWMTLGDKEMAVKHVLIGRMENSVDTDQRSLLVWLYTVFKTRNIQV